jgi:PAS domain S-box-containing protein/putative nucleotidyltransferase with HDIG domain
MYPEKIAILIIEDNPADARLVKEILSESNGTAYDLKYAVSLSDGLKMISENSFDIVLLDLSLTDSADLDTISGITAKNSHIPMVALTGKDDLNVATQALNLGVQDYLVKGQFDGAMLSRAIRYAIERKRNEIELKKNEGKYRSLFENSVDGIYITTPQGNYVDANASLVNMLGYKSKKELIVIDIKKELYVSEKERPGPEGRNKIFETRLRKKDGDIIHVQISPSVEYVDGKPKYYQGIVRDITERIQFQDKLVKVAREWTTTFDSMKDAISITDLEGRILRANKAMLKMNNKNFKDIIGNTCQNLVSIISHPQNECPLKRTKLSKKREIRTIKAGDKYLECIVDPILDQNNNITGTVHILTDITEQEKAKKEIKENLSKIKRTFEQTINTLGNLIEVKDPYTSGHQKKVALISVAIAKNLGLSKETVEAIRTASLIHDIGKISIPQSILSKPGKLSNIEMDMIKTHSLYGYDIIKEIDFSQPIAEIILQHHEKINGSGYPNGLKGKEIMQEAKIIAVADVFEAMTSHRPYRPALSLEDTMNELKNNKRTLYDPDVVDCLINYIDSYYKIELGDHLCSIYNDFEVQISFIVPYMDIGLQKNHKCIYITDENSIESITNAFRLKGTNLSAYLGKGQFVFFTSNDTYLKDGYLDPDRMISFLKAMEKTALKEGFGGIRVTGETTWILSKLPGTERFMEYENKLNEFFPGSRATAICQYSESKFDKKILIEVIKAHPKVGINGLFYNNKFYKEPSAVSSKDELNGVDYKDIEKKYYSLIEKIKK